MSRKKSRWNLGDKLLNNRNNNEFMTIYSHYSLVCKNRFKWENLPNNIESRHVEKAIYEYGMAILYKDEIKGFMILPCTVHGQLNPFGDALEYMVMSYNGSETGQIIKAEDCVIIRENDDAIPISLTVFTYCSKIAETERTSVINLKQQRKPYIISVTENNKLSMQNLYDDIESGKEAVFVDKRKTEGGNVGIDVLATNSEYLLDKLSLYADKQEYKLLSLLGVNNIDTNKKERLITDEVNANNASILLNLDIGFKGRELAAKQAKEKFNLDLKVEKTIHQLENTFKGESTEKKDLEI